MRYHNRLRKGFATAVAVMAVFGPLVVAPAATAATATAGSAMRFPDEVWLVQGKDYGVVPRDEDAYVCDKEADGHRVYIHVWFDDDANRRFYDGNGSDWGCGPTNIEGDDDIAKVKVCEQVDLWPDDCATWEDD